MECSKYSIWACKSSGGTGDSVDVLHQRLAASTW